MDKVIFDKNQYCGTTLIHKVNKAYECIAEDQDHYYIRQEGCPNGKNWCSSFPKECDGGLFKFVD